MLGLPKPSLYRRSKIASAGLMMIRFSCHSDESLQSIIEQRSPLPRRSFRLPLLEECPGRMDAWTDGWMELMNG